MSKGNSFYPLSASHYPLFFVFAVLFGLTACAPKGEELYDLKADPEELHDLYTERGDVARELLAALKATLAEVNAPYM